MAVTDEEWARYLELKKVQEQIRELQISIGIAAVNTLYPGATNEKKQKEITLLMGYLDSGVLSNFYIDAYNIKLKEEPNKTQMKNLVMHETELETLVTKPNLLDTIFLAKDTTRISSELYDKMPPLLKEQFIAKEKIIASQAKQNANMKGEEMQYSPRTTKTIYIRKDSDEGSKINEENIKATKNSDRINTFAPLPPPPEGMGYVRNGKGFVRGKNGYPIQRPLPLGPPPTFIGGRKRTSKRKTHKKRRTNRSKRIHKFRT